MARVALQRGAGSPEQPWRAGALPVTLGRRLPRRPVEPQERARGRSLLGCASPSSRHAATPTLRRSVAAGDSDVDHLGELARTPRSRWRPHDEQPGTTGELLCSGALGEHSPQPTANPIAHHGRPNRPGDGEGHPGRHDRPSCLVLRGFHGVLEVHDGDRSGYQAPTPPLEGGEGGPIPDPVDQADSRARPRWRRARRMRRPALVDMRWRNPWRRARRRVLGW